MKNYYQHIVRLLIVIGLLYSSDFHVTKAASSAALTGCFRDTVLLTQSAALKPDTVLAYADKMPEFPGGRDSMMRFIQSHIEIPDEATETGIDGRVYVQFIVNKQGKVLNPKVLKGIGKGCDEAALKLVNSFPLMSPAVKDGNIVDVYYTLPITFKVETDAPLTFIEKMPQFPGGQYQLMKFIRENIRYTDETKKMKFKDNLVIQFLVTKNGKIEKPSILKSLGKQIDDEAIRLVSSFPDWIPGEQNGHPVSVYYVLPINFNYKQIKRISETNDSRGRADYQSDSTLMYAALSMMNIIRLNDIEASFPGGNDSLYSYLERNLEYPKDAEKDGISGNVQVKVGISPQGKVSKVEILKPLYPSLDAEAVRVLSRSPLWSPAKKNSQPVSSEYNLTIFFNSNGSKKDILDSTEEVPLTFVEQQPQFPGGIDEMMKYLANNIRYPEKAAELGISGKVAIQFVVSKKGKVHNIKVLRGIGGGCDEEAVRMISAMPDWIPGRQNGKPVAVFFVLPISFKLKE